VNCRGQVAFMAMAFIALAAGALGVLVLDLGRAFVVRVQLQNAADAAALGGALAFHDSIPQPWSWARDMVHKNATVHDDGIHIEVVEADSLVRVALARELQLMFGSLVGIPFLEVWAIAAARADSAGGSRLVE
jgi:uncharacterized membrane protein